MAHELLRDVLRAGDADGRARRRRIMVPLSIALHGVAAAAVLIAPLAAEVDPPDIVRPAPRVFHVVAAPPAPVVVPARAVSAPAPARVAPSEAPAAILDEVAVPEPAPSGVPGPVDIGSVVGTHDGWGSAPIGDPAGVPVAMPPPPPPREPLRIGGDIAEPRKVADAVPVYPAIALAARKEGVVILEALIDEQGRVANVKVLRSAPLLDDAAVQAVRRWRYTPTRLNGVPVPVLMTVTVRFQLR